MDMDDPNKVLTRWRFVRHFLESQRQRCITVVNRECMMAVKYNYVWIFKNSTWHLNIWGYLTLLSVGIFYWWDSIEQILNKYKYFGNTSSNMIHLWQSYLQPMFIPSSQITMLSNITHISSIKEYCNPIYILYRQAMLAHHK